MFYGFLNHFYPGAAPPKPPSEAQVRYAYPDAPPPSYIFMRGTKDQHSAPASYV
jgi:hypothetical protein